MSVRSTKKYAFHPQVEDNESFYLTFLRGTVGILSLDALELSPEWDSGVGDTGESNDDHSKDTHGSSSAGSGSGSGTAAKVTRSRASSQEVPLLGEAQWQRLRKVLEEQVRTGKEETARAMVLNENQKQQQAIW